MSAPWEHYVCTIPENGAWSKCAQMDVVHHATHTTAALRIIEERKISRGLIYDKCSLRNSRTTVVWLSPNQWVDGSRYGNVEFTYDFRSLVKAQKIYWVEVHTGYSPHACRFLITDEDVRGLPVQLYDPAKEKGPLRYVDGIWYWNFTYTGEFMLQNILWLDECIKVDFIKHHPIYCAMGGCNDRGKTGERAAGRVVAQILSRKITTINEQLIVTEPKKALSDGVEFGLSRILNVLKANAGKLDGPLKSEDRVDAVLRAALLQHASGELNAAIETASLIKSDDIFRARLAAIVEDHFGLKSKLLANI